MHRRLDWLIPDWLQSADAFIQPQNLDLEVLGFLFVVNAFFWIFCLFFFCVCRIYFPSIFTPKAKKPKNLPNEDMYSWIFSLWSIDDSTIIEYSGYDAYIFLRFYKLSVKVFSIFSIYALLILMPLHGQQEADPSLGSFDRWTMTVVPLESQLLWAHVIGMFLLALVTARELEKEFVIYAKHRHDYLRQRKAHLRTVLVEGIPKELRSTVTIAAFFETLYPNAVYRVKLCHNIKYLDQLGKERLDVLTRLERYMYQAYHTNKRPTTMVGAMTRPVDAITYYSRTLTSLNSAIDYGKKSAFHNAHICDSALQRNAVGIVESYLQVQNVGTISRLLVEKGFTSAEFITVDSFGPDGAPPSDTKAHLSIKQNADLSDSEDNVSICDYCIDALSRTIDWPSVGNRNRSAENDLLIAREDDRKLFLSKAFVTFKSFTAATIARQVLHTQSASHMKVSEAPHQLDIIWPNVFLSLRVRAIRKLFGDMFMLLLTILWVVPVTIISFALSEESLRRRFQSIDRACVRNSLVASSVGMIQPVALIFLMNILPNLLTIITELEGYISRSAIEKIVFERYFNFQVINVFLVSTIAGSVLDCIAAIVQNPSRALVLLGESLPKMGGFFMAYICIKAFTGLGLELTRVLAFLGQLCKSLFTKNTTPRDRQREYLGWVRSIDCPSWFPYSIYLAQDALVVVVCLTYACIAPVMLTAGIYYFSSAYFVYKHQMLYVYNPIFETGGSLWPLLATRYVVALLVAQSTMTGMMILKCGWHQLYTLILLMVLTYAYLRRIHVLYEPLAEQLPLDQAAVLDLELEEDESARDLRSTEEDFIQPSLVAKSDLKPWVDAKVSEVCEHL